ncbi:MAG: hypothetical protein PHC61_10470, partial [Chitinivibrionales bacterium]|nr:hypothetical protein [Chitinivibrionales bacterium]
LNNLVAETDYLIQLFISSASDGYNNPAQQLGVSQNDGTTLVAYGYGNPPNALGQYVVGTFTAAAGTQAFTIKGLVGSGFPRVNAIQVRNLGNPSTPPPIPQLISPVNGATGISSDTTVLLWHLSTSAGSYALQVALDNAFGSVVLNQSENDTMVILSTLLDSTTYYWRVNAVNANNVASDWSEVRSFTTAPPVPPAVPALLTPLNNATSIDINPTLKWQAAYAATSYHVQVSASSGFSSTVYDQSGITGVSSAVTPTLTGGAIYYWRANAHNRHGTSSWSQVFTFTTTATGTPAVPTLLTPANNGTNVSVTTLLSWNGIADSFSIQISNVNDFSKAINFRKIANTTQQVAKLWGDTTYYWRVKAYNGSLSSGWSSVNTFSTGDDGSGGSSVTAPARPRHRSWTRDYGNTD